MTNSIEYSANTLSAEDFCSLRRAVGFPEKPLPQVRLSLERGLYNVTASADGRTVGMGRLVGDGVMYWYIQDVIIPPEYQGRGIGREIISRLLAHVREASLSGTTVTVGLMAAKGKQGFYEKLGFTARPNERMDAGMIMLLDVE